VIEREIALPPIVLDARWPVGRRSARKMAHAEAHEHNDHGHAVADGDDLPHHGAVLEEPKSPTWLPFLGVALFGLLLVWWLSTPSEDEEARAAAAASASASASAQEAPQPANAPQPGAAPQPQPQPQPIAPGAKGAPGIPSGFKVAPTVTINPAFRPK